MSTIYRIDNVPALAKTFVMQTLTSDLFAVAKLLVNDWNNFNNVEVW